MTPRPDGAHRRAAPNFADGMGGERIAAAMAAAHGDPVKAMLILARSGCSYPLPVPQRARQPDFDAAYARLSVARRELAEALAEAPG